MTNELWSQWPLSQNFGGGLGLANAPQGAVLGACQYESFLLQHQLANYNAQQTPLSPFKAQRFSQNWLNAMLDVELGL